MAEDLPYQATPAIEQALAERANADALGLTDAVDAADKRLDALGYKKRGRAKAAETAAAEAASAGEDETAKAAEARAEAAKGDDEAKSEPPKDRSAAKKQNTADK